MREGGGGGSKKATQGQKWPTRASALLYTFSDVHSKGKGYFILSRVEESKWTMSYRFEPGEGV